MTTANRIFTIAGVALAIGGATHYLTRRYWGQTLPKRLFQGLKAAHPDATGGWMDHRPQQQVQEDRLVVAYSGGLITKTATFSFVVAQDGTVLTWEETLI